MESRRSQGRLSPTSYLPQSSSASRFTARRSRILEFEPVRRLPRSVTRSKPLRDNSLQPHLAGVLEYDGALRVLQCSLSLTPGRLLRSLGPFPNRVSAKQKFCDERHSVPVTRFTPKSL